MGTDQFVVESQCFCVLRSMFSGLPVQEIVSPQSDDIIFIELAQVFVLSSEGRDPSIS